MLKFPFMPAIFSVTCAYLEQQGQSSVVKYSCAFLLGGLYLTLVKYK